MFVRRLLIQRIDQSGAPHPCPIAWIDNFAMRNFTNNAVFDDTLPVAMACSKPATASPSIASSRPCKIGSAAKAISSRKTASKSPNSARRPSIRRLGGRILHRVAFAPKLKLRLAPRLQSRILLRPGMIPAQQLLTRGVILSRVQLL